MGEMIDAQIIRDFDDKVAIGISSTKASSSISKNMIQFRGKPAPKNLLKLNTVLKVKLSNNQVIYAEIDQNIEIIAFFGYIGSINNDNKTLAVKTYYHDQDITFQELLGPDNKPLKSGVNQSLMSQPVILFLNKDAVIEARILNEKIANSYKLAEFYKNQLGDKENEFFVLKDDRLISHKIHKSRIFYKNCDENFSEFEVNESIGTEVKIVIENNQGKKEIKAIVQKDKAKNQYINKFESSLSLPPKRNSLIEQKLAPLHGLRQKINDNFFIKEYDGLDKSSMILLSLLEIGYRIYDWPMKETLYKDITQTAHIHSSDLEKLNLLLSNYITQEVGGIEKFYKLFKESISVLEYISKSMFKIPLNLNFISHKYQVYIFETNKSFQPWKTYKPLYVNEPIPIIYLCNDSKLGILYNQDMMDYDGYSSSGDEYVAKQYFDTSLIKTQYRAEPNYLDVLNSAKRIQEKLPRTDEESYKIYFELVNALNTLNLPNNEPKCEQLYQELLNFNYDPNYTDIKCYCGEKINQSFKCNNHYLCEKCALISWKLNSCLECNSEFKIEVNIKQICSTCSNTYDSNILFGFRCRCIICHACLHYLLTQGYRICYKQHNLDDSSIHLALNFLKSLGYNIGL